MVTSRGKSEVLSFLARLPEEIETKLLRGAGRAAATVVADEAKDRSVSDEVSQAIKVATKREPGQIVAKVQVKGPGAYKAPWLEYGTEPHFISVDDSQRDGMSIGKINRETKAGALVIGGNFVGTTVFHPGARPYPFLRPALDVKETEAVAAAQAYINTRISRGRIVGRAETDGDSE
ncbi:MULTISPECIES: HK97 gp10 family phage protein [unclassified Sphingobium]|uniref:HK97 gp10 family phage protein n=1 Tax=unclassified Sphingobium TaxID=2611147 RepID=UPI0022255BC0|nr:MULTISPECIES: HK97 gp10 family phage protein [unclassified Sphingobium]MCW2395887.1 hypothetical protein [Sphingobium sp. B8D3B]MCW2419403.1 hypothetical protein [Sphingobium sp. B8D3C]